MPVAIKPIEMSGVVQRSQDVSQMKQQENNKALVDGQNFGQHFNKEVKHQMNSVTNTQKSEKKKDAYDAKNKGNGREYSEQQKDKKDKKKNNDKVTLKSQSNFDIRI